MLAALEGKMQPELSAYTQRGLKDGLSGVQRTRCPDPMPENLTRTRTNDQDLPEPKPSHPDQFSQIRFNRFSDRAALC